MIAFKLKNITKKRNIWLAKNLLIKLKINVNWENIAGWNSKKLAGIFLNIIVIRNF